MAPPSHKQLMAACPPEDKRRATRPGETAPAVEGLFSRFAQDAHFGHQPTDDPFWLFEIGSAESLAFGIVAAMELEIDGGKYRIVEISSPFGDSDLLKLRKI